MIHTIYMLELSCCLISLIPIGDLPCGLRPVVLLKALSQRHHIMLGLLLCITSLLIFIPYTFLDVGWNISVLGFWCVYSPPCVVCVVVNVMILGPLTVIWVVLFLISAAFGALVLAFQMLFVLVRKEVRSAHLSVVLVVTTLDCIGSKFIPAWRSLLLRAMVSHFILSPIIFNFLCIFFLHICFTLLLHDFLNIVLDLILVKVLININDFIIIL